ncbi:MAG: NAD(P)/FAD-dependent oxidoreductase [Gemmataceae bacterium]|nr:NAD(P)/FAD-dependent oxidoreductase [Gemmataceae bacterium]
MEAEQGNHQPAKVGQPYRAWDGNGTFDAVVIGSGMGALTVAAILAKRAGQRVLVLERHYTVGGFTHVFKRPGYEWDVGLHYIGEMQQPGSELRAVFDYITDGQLAWADIGDVYDRIITPAGAYDLVAGAERFRARLKEYFPREGRAIDRYLGLLASCFWAVRPFFIEKVLPGPLSWLVGPLMRMPFLRYARPTTRAVLESLTQNQELIGVLTGQWYNYGLPPGRSSFAMHAIMAGHYLGGASYPVGGASRVAAAIAPVIVRAGGKILINAEVTQILVERGRALGVRMSDGREIRAGVVISGAGVLNTYTRLLPAPVADGLGLPDRLRPLEPSIAHLNLYVGLRQSDKQLGLGTANLWVHPSPDHDRNVADYLADPSRPLPCLWFCFSSAKDPTFPARHPGRATLQVMTYASYDSFRRWDRARWHRRGEDYEALKQRFAALLLEKLYEHVPQVRGQVGYSELATPVTTRHFANYASGEIYGLAHTPVRFRQRFLRPRTPIRNLYLTGQDVANAGVAGAMLGGVFCATCLLTPNLYWSILKEERRRHSSTDAK